MRATFATPSKLLRTSATTAAAVAATAMFSTQALADEFNMPVGVTDISREVYNLHMGIFYVCCVIGAIVFGVLI